MPAVCPQCPGAAVEDDPTRGCSFCVSCGAVLEESTITSELTFVEGADGAARMVGQFVGSEQSGLRAIHGLRNRRLMTTQSREETISNARRRFNEVATVLRGLNDYHVERAVQCYKLALAHNFTQGRKQSHVIAACLYTVCRQEKTVHMLIDFSDVLHANVFTLGTTFLKLIRILNIQLPLIDPSLYLARFAAQLEFGDKLQLVTTDALRLVQRMKRDWIHYGRRPAGICGACLLIAARMHGFKRTQMEVIRVVKICDMTLRKRLSEFAETPSAELTIDQFRNTELSTEANPPSFHRGGVIVVGGAGGGAASSATSKGKTTDSGDGAPTTMDSISAADLVEAEMRTALASETLRRALPLQQQPATANTWVDTPVGEDPAEWDDVSDGEIDAMILADEEAQLKGEMWMEANADWEEAQEAKRKRQEEIEANGGPPPKQRRQRKPASATTQRRITPHATTAEAAREIIAKRVAPKISKKINYAALENLFKEG